MRSYRTRSSASSRWPDHTDARAARAARSTGRPGWRVLRRLHRGSEVESGDHVREPVRLPELDAVPRGKPHQLLRVGRTGGEGLGELAEEALEAGRTDDLDHSGRYGARVPHRVHLAAGLGDVAAGTKDDLPVTGPE